MADEYKYLTYKADDFIAKSAELIAQSLRQAISLRGMASLMVSGGRSPAKVYQALSHIDLPWDKVAIGLVDERCVSAGQSGSNADFVARNLLQNKADKARFIGLEVDRPKSKARLSAYEINLAPLQPFDICVMGMGLDGHTASWFPNAVGLDAALDMTNQKTVVAINAIGCAVAGDYPERISLTLSAVLKSQHVILMIAGAQKAAVFDESLGYSMAQRPATALLAAGPRLTVLTDEI